MVEGAVGLVMTTEETRAVAAGAVGAAAAGASEDEDRGESYASRDAANHKTSAHNGQAWPHKVVAL